MVKVHERFLKYVAFDTTSNPSSDVCPSSEGQKVLGRFLVEEMKQMGISNVVMDEHGYVYGDIPSNSLNSKAPKLAFIAHMDTSPDLSGKNVKAKIIEKYDGEDIVLNASEKMVLSPQKFPKLTNYVGQDLIVTDGTTLLGADNKAGIAEILSLAEYLINTPEFEHGDIKIAFTPDEEIGKGANLFNLDQLNADFGYTVDGGELGEIEFENFNAATAIVTIKGSNIHPGNAKGKMKNALLIGMELHQMLPVFDNPAYTEKYEGFNHLNDFHGHVEDAEMLYIIRDHDMKKFEQKKALFRSIEGFLNEKYGSDSVTISMTDSYFNMREKVMPHYHLVDNAVEAMKSLQIDPLVVPIRGGTDGARLSFMGLPCPNLCTGGHNFHGRYEFISIQSMEQTVEILKKIVQKYAQWQ